MISEWRAMHNANLPVLPNNSEVLLEGQLFCQLLFGKKDFIVNKTFARTLLCTQKHGINSHRFHVCICTRICVFLAF